MVENKKKSEPENAADWLQLVKNFQNSRRESSSVIGLYYNPQIREDGPAGKHGGFFPKITEENYRAEIARLFTDEPDKGKWFLEYLQTGKTQTLSAEQKQFVQSYDRFMSSFLDSRTAAYSPEVRGLGIVVSESFSREVTKDQTLTDAEHAALLEKGAFGKDMKDMGALSLPFIYLTGGIVQGAMDYEEPQGPAAKQKEAVYRPEELAPFYSPEGNRQLQEKNKNSQTVTFLVNKNPGFSDYVAQMENICGTNPALTFTPGDTPTLLNKYNVKAL